MTVICSSTHRAVTVQSTLSTVALFVQSDRPTATVHHHCIGGAVCSRCSWAYS